MTQLTKAQKYIVEKWPEVNKAAIKYDKEQFYKAEEKKKAKRKQLDNALLMQKTTEKVLEKAKKVEKSKRLSKKTEKEQKEPIKTQKKEKVKQTTKTERERI